VFTVAQPTGGALFHILSSAPKLYVNHKNRATKSVLKYVFYVFSNVTQSFEIITTALFDPKMSVDGGVTRGT